MAARFPFSAVVGHDEVKTALLLCAVDPRIGGVLLRGEKGTAKTTLARGLAALLPGGAPFVELPVGATEDRVGGSLDVAAALTGGEVRFSPGLLAAAHGGVLYVDEVNLLADHLVDLLLDAAATGEHRVEREGVSHAHPARFVLAGSMNPEEGELRPQLLDRFGLCVDVRSEADPAGRAEAVRRRLAFDADPEGFAGVWRAEEDSLAGRLAAARRAAVDAGLVDAVASLCAAVGAEGLRADLTICRAAAALAGLEGRLEASEADVRRVAPLALAHRARRNPLDDHGLDRPELDRALDDALGPPPPPEPGGGGEQAPSPPAPPGRSGSDPGGPAAERPAAAAAPPERVVSLDVGRQPRPGPGGRRATVEGPRGRHVTSRPGADGGPVAVGATARAAAARRAVDPAGPLVAPADVHHAVREQRAGSLVVLVVDASASMGAVMAAAKGAVVSLLLDAYQRRDQVAMVTVGGGGAAVALRPTGSVEVARARLDGLPTGGRTDIAAGLDLALGVAGGAGDRAPLVVVVTDGRPTAAAAGADPLDAALAAGARLRRRGVDAVVVDVEDGPATLGLSARLAGAMGARCLRLPELTAGALHATVRRVLEPGPER